MNFQEKIIALSPKLLNYAKFLTKDEEKAKDLTQNVILKCLRKENLFDGENFSGWVYMIMRNEFINDFRLSKRRKEIINTFDISFIQYPIPDTDSKLRINEILSSIDSLTITMQKALKLHIEGYKYDEIAKKLNVPVGTVKSRIFLARKELQYTAKENEKRLTLKFQRNT